MGDNDKVAGIDGCKAGWIVATEHAVEVIPRLNLDHFTIVGIDMPIGLLDGPPRACDVAARKYLELKSCLILRTRLSTR